MTKTTSNEVEAFLALFFVFFMGDANQILSDFILGWLINFFHNGLFDYKVIKKEKRFINAQLENIHKRQV